MSKLIGYAVLIVCIVNMASCGSDPNNTTPPYVLPKNARKLISGDSSKTWKIARRFNNKTRMNMGDCFLSHLETFHSAGTMHNNSGEHIDCGPTLNAQWEFAINKKGDHFIKLTSDQIPELLNVEQNYKLFKVLYLSSEEMRLQFQHRQFSNKWTTITDIFVPENADIEGREFHW